MTIYLTVEIHTKETLTTVINTLLENDIFDFKINTEIKTTKTRDALGVSNTIKTSIYQVRINNLYKQPVVKLLEVFSNL